MAEAVEKIPPIPPRRGSAYTKRFVLAYLLMIGVFAGVIGLFAFLVSRSDSAARWSAFQPSGRDAFDKAQNLANYVAPRYVEQGIPVATVQAQPLIYQNTVLDGIAFERATSRDSIGGGVNQFEPAGSTIMYVFCGPGDACGPSQTASAATEALLRRESVELALYTFKYTHGINSIVALLPPTKNTKPAIFLTRRAFRGLLSKPLSQTLPTRRFITGGSLTGEEQSKIQKLTANSVFASTFEALPNQRALLLLAPGNG